MCQVPLPCGTSNPAACLPALMVSQDLWWIGGDPRLAAQQPSGSNVFVAPRAACAVAALLDAQPEIFRDAFVNTRRLAWTPCRRCRAREDLKACRGERAAALSALSCGSNSSGAWCPHPLPPQAPCRIVDNDTQHLHRGLRLVLGRRGATTSFGGPAVAISSSFFLPNSCFPLAALLLGSENYVALL